MSERDAPYRGSPATNQPRSERYYRERAEEIRELASRTPHAEVRQDLIALSLRYEHLADRAKSVAENAPNWSHPSGDLDEPLTGGDVEELPQPD
ncbi:MAG: hypothetical protein ACREU2_06665 [Steroidobacteraceae bacterium]